MKKLNITIERLNKFFNNHTFEVLGIGVEAIEDTPINAKVQITGVKEYNKMGEKTPFIEYTLYILPHKEDLNVYYKVLRNHFGRETDIDTRSDKY